MDILISSNLERLLYLLGGAERNAQYMRELAENGRYSLDTDIKATIDKDFTGYFCDEANTAQTIKETFDAHRYLCDTHTAVGLYCAKQYYKQSHSKNHLLLASTASPYKFASDVYTALTKNTAGDELRALAALADYTGIEIPAPLRDIDKRAVRFTKTIDADEMKADVLHFAG